MSYRWSQLSPHTSTRGSRVRIAVHGPWSAPPENYQDVQILRSWLEYDSEEDQAGTRGGITWNMVAGFALVTVVSASFWAGVGLIVARIWR